MSNFPASAAGSPRQSGMSSGTSFFEALADVAHAGRRDGRSHADDGSRTRTFDDAGFTKQRVFGLMLETGDDNDEIGFGREFRR
jgi:hypothetical protein